MMLVTASSTARVTDRHSCSEKPILSVNRSIAPRTAQSNSGLLGNSSFSSKSVFNVLTPRLAAQNAEYKRGHVFETLSTLRKEKTAVLPKVMVTKWNKLDRTVLSIMVFRNERLPRRTTHVQLFVPPRSTDLHYAPCALATPDALAARLSSLCTSGSRTNNSRAFPNSAFAISLFMCASRPLSSAKMSKIPNSASPSFTAYHVIVPSSFSARACADFKNSATSCSLPAFASTCAQIASLGMIATCNWCDATRHEPVSRIHETRFICGLMTPLETLVIRLGSAGPRFQMQYRSARGLLPILCRVCDEKVHSSRIVLERSCRPLMYYATRVPS